MQENAKIACNLDKIGRISRILIIEQSLRTPTRATPTPRARPNGRVERFCSVQKLHFDEHYIISKNSSLRDSEHVHKLTSSSWILVTRLWNQLRDMNLQRCKIGTEWPTHRCWLNGIVKSDRSHGTSFILVPARSALESVCKLFAILQLVCLFLNLQIGTPRLR